MTQLNTPYPSTAYLTGFLRSRGFDAVQEDLALATVLALLNKKGLTALRDAALALPVEERSGGEPWSVQQGEHGGQGQVFLHCIKPP